MHCWIQSKKIPIQKGFGVDVGQVARSLFDKLLSACAVYILCVQHPVFIRSWNVYLTTVPQPIESWNPSQNVPRLTLQPELSPLQHSRPLGLLVKGNLIWKDTNHFLILLLSRNSYWWKSLVPLVLEVSEFVCVEKWIRHKMVRLFKGIIKQNK